MTRCAVVVSTVFVLIAGSAAPQVFQADFQNATVAARTSPTNVNSGTAIGSWAGLPDAAAQTAWVAEGVRIGEDTASGNKALLLDRFEVAPINVDAVFSESIPLDGAVIDMKVSVYRTQTDSHDKDVYITGLDGAGNKSFEVVLSAPNVSGTLIAEGRRIAYVHPTNGLTMVPQGVQDELTGGGGAALAVPAPANFSGITITCGPTGYVIQHTGRPGVNSWTSDVLPYNGSATEIAKVHFFGKEIPNAQAAGFWVDDLSVTGAAPIPEPEPQGNRILSNVYPPFIDVGTTVVLLGPEGTGHQWRKDGADITGATERELIFSPVRLEDAGEYRVQYNDGTKAIMLSDPFFMEVSPEGTVPAAGVIGLAALLGACAAGGARLIRRRK